MTQKVWGGRFREEPDARVNRFNASLDFDRRLFAQDIEGSMVHCRMLVKLGLLTQEEATLILQALEEIRGDLERDPSAGHPDSEDIHSLVEKALVEKVGPLGEKLHAGRSRNDQVALDMRLFMRGAVQRLIRALTELQSALLSLAEAHLDWIMPGYTHLQRAQPVLLTHHLLAYHEMLCRDRQRLQESLKRVNIFPGGSAALGGAGFELDLEMMARELGFEAVSRNSMDAVSDRDFVLEYLFHAAVLMMHLSRLSEEIIIWSSQEFGFVTISDTFCTGSSIMPQKRNPDVPELIRGKTGRVYGHLMALLTTMKGLPLAYNKDMQEDKEGLFDAADTVEACVEIMTGLLGALSFHREQLHEAAGKGFLTATDLADYLVRKGLTFRKAHETVGKIVLHAAEQEKELRDLSLETLQGFAEAIGPDVHEWLDPAASVARRNLPGGTGPEAVKAALTKAREELKS